MPSAENIQPDSRFFGLFIGRSGSGKSAAAYSFPHPVKVFDLDGRIRGGLTSWIERKGIDYEYYPPITKDSTTYQKLNTAFDILLIQAQSGQCPYKTIVFDSLTWAAIDLLNDAIPLTHADGKGKSVGKTAMAGPADYGFQSQNMANIIAYLKSLNVPNIIVTAHKMNKYGKAPGADAYAPNIIVGEQLALTDKLAESLPSSFDHIFDFKKIDTGGGIRHVFSAQGELARTPFPIPYGDIDITGKNFYEGLMKMAVL